MSNKVWISSKTNAWELGNLIKDNLDGTLTVEGSDGKKNLPKAEVFRTDPSHFEDTDDLCSMNHLSEAPLLDCLRRRFIKDRIYTTTGDVLISVNPYKRIPGLYDSIVKYLDVPEDGELDATATPPHVYKIANFALVELLYGKRSGFDKNTPSNQSIVVSGESGAGKTEASKHVMNFLIAADQEIKSTPTNNNVQEDLGDAIKKVLVESNIIFEAFGNSKTLRNDNSSRFGKYIKLQYSSDNRIISAYTETFLLEKSRLMNVGAGERNYHVFYQFLRGNKDVALANRLYLKSPEKFKMLLDLNGTALPSDQDSLYDELLQALETLGCSKAEIEALWSLLAALLHIGNMSCTVLSDGEIEVPESQENASYDVGHVRIHSPTIPLEALTEILGISNELFVSRLTTQRVKISTRRSVTIKRLNEIDIMNNIAALIKWVYSCLFSWLIKKINFAHCSVSSDSTKAVKFIGILDIFGFEILQTNSFEQLCINYTNERLQQQFNEYVFDREQDIYRKEGLDWTSIAYKDNQHVIDLIGKKPTGLLIILEGQGMLNRGAADEGALVSSFNQTHDKNNTAYVKSRFGTDGKFTIRHFAGEVTYLVTGFMEKNNDSLQEDLMELMICSSNQFVQNAIVAVGLDSPPLQGELGFIDQINQDKVVKSAGNLSMSARPGGAPPEDTKKRIASTGRRTSLVASDGGGKKLAATVTVSFQFRSQLDMLLVTLRATSPHYIKCVKPNTNKIPGQFDPFMVLEQLRYSGALEVVRIRQEGFPICLSFINFYETFDILAFKRGWIKSSDCTSEQAKEYTTTLCSESLIFKQDYQIGNTKVFMRTESYERMYQAMMRFVSKKITKFQTFFRCKSARHQYKAKRHATLLLQAKIRMFIQRSKYNRLITERIEARERERKRIEEERRISNLNYEKRINELHASCLAGDIENVKALLKVHPEDYTSRNNNDKNCTVLHSALKSGNLQLIRFLNPSNEDLHIKDEDGNSAVHQVILTYRSNILDVLRYLCTVAEGTNDLPLDLNQMSLRPKHNSDLPKPPKSITSTQSVPPEDALEDVQIDSISPNTELKSGWLSKRGESSLWRKRWVVLTTEALMYFRNPKDQIPRDTLSFSTKNDLQIERSPTKATAIDIHINHQSIQKKRDRISLMADSEQEMQIWLTLLKAAAGVESKSLRPIASTSANTKAKPFITQKPSARASIFQLTNNSRQTALHLLAQYEAPEFAQTGSELTKDDALVLIFWLISNHCPLNTFDHLGYTPLQIAVEKNHVELSGLLAKHGADPEARLYGQATKRRSIDMTNSQDFQTMLKNAYTSFEARGTNGSFLSLPPRLRGYHYLSICFYKFDIFISDDFIPPSNPRQHAIKVSTHNKNNLLVEAPQISPSPLIRAPEGIDKQTALWLETYHLQFPLDNLQDHSYVVFEFIHKEDGDDEAETLATAKFELDFSTISSEPIIIPFYSTDPKNNNMVHSKLSAEVIITKRK